MLDVLDLDRRDLDPPRLGLLVDDLLQVLVELLALGQQRVEVGLAEHRAQRGLRDLQRRLRASSTLTTSGVASTTRKYATASTRAVTLSRVMTSCGGIPTVRVRSDTRTMRSMPGISSTSPGPRSPTSRPRRNTTARSYSRSTRTEAAASAAANTKRISTAVKIAAIRTAPSPRHGGPSR
jgi:hypothetical protein